ncbi:MULTISPECIES: response regulator [Shewanella]|jgi:two-component system chemotaxis response regulator CheY|uniref:Response regulator n=1 Tax=Shewanella chilikensis TaxID=558541 RepID=A0A6G7LXD3_9GAMM|nr:MULTISPECIES: response regulator [Shewanella]MBZ4677737.1 response regulator [Shewanella sp.]MCA0950943.1 response regulator [Shewanella chilikensis]MCE9852004.1 response regulator [Shewanella chilikensis]MCL1153681.1 response regulator [Shewanella chilikensis]PYE59538.1 two-component system chemotaxis response regulator CheY [Shewanella chilikensis]
MKTILAVDDSASMRQMVSFTLKTAGFDVTEANNGEEALKVAQGREFDLVISDVNMPIMDGIELIRNLRELPNYKFVPMLMLTTESTSDKKQQGRAAGATGWIVKPFNPDQLLATVRKVLG